MIVRIDNTAGFCWGVVRTIDTAEGALQGEEKMYSLGDIIHNPVEVERLASLGLTSITHDDLDSIDPKTKVLIRAHGEPPETYRKARARGIELIDATCPVVTKLQERIKKFYDQEFQIVIFGKKDHAEVIGLRGVTNDTCIVIKTVEEALEKIDLTKKTVLFSQTTMDKPTFYKIKEVLETKISELIVDTLENLATDFLAKDTICGQVSGREKKLTAFAQAHDVMIFVAGKKSSNGKVLFDVCKAANPRTYFIEHEKEIDAVWFESIQTVGISGATSTPQWLMERVKNFIESRYQSYVTENESAPSTVGA